MIESIKIIRSDIKIGKGKFNILAYEGDILLIVKNEIQLKQFFVEVENTARLLELHINEEKTKYKIVEWKNSSK